MTLQLQSWEHRLTSLAYEALHSNAIAPLAMPLDQSQMNQAYEYCRSVTAQHSRSFYLASALLPPEKRRAVRALYAFCRVSDDVVDDAPTYVNAAAGLEAWRKTALTLQPASDKPVALAWADARQRFQIPQCYAEQLIDGVARDLHQTRYTTFSELATYAYGVASTVGLMSMHIIGFSRQEAIPYAVKLGVALQLTNILRDVGEDWQAGRLYLPQEELHAFGLGEADIAAGRVTDGWRDFMRFQIARNRQLYQEAWPGIAMLDSDGRLAIAAAARFYQAILHNIETHDYNVFHRRAYVSAAGKLRMLPGLWWQCRRMGSPSGVG